MLVNMIDYIRFTLYAVLLVIGLVLFQAWEKEHPKIIPATETTLSASNNYIPEINAPNAATTTKTVAAPLSTEPTLPMVSHPNIQVSTDLLDIKIDALGGNITQVKLKKFPAELHSPEQFVLLNDAPETKYIAQSGLLSPIGPDTSRGQALYTSLQDHYVLEDNQNEVQVKLFWRNNEGVNITKIFTFHRGDYDAHITYQVNNLSKVNWQGNLYTQLMRKNTPPASTQGFVNLATYFGAAISSPEKPFKKITFKEMAQNNLNQTITGGWAAMIQHYFISAWIPDKNTPMQYFTKITNDNLYTVGMIGPTLTAAPGTTVETKAHFYAGPAETSRLEKVAPGLQLTIDYGWFWFISTIIFWMMQKIYNVVGNWGWSIVLVTLVIKLLFFHLSAKSYRSMSALKNLQPKINALKERYGEDKQKFTQATLELYKKEKVNPMSGCLPILIQIPVFIGLYWVLIESVELRQAPFILWIHDLSTKDPFYVLPVLMGISMFLQQRLNPPAPDPMQQKIMMMMPIIFTALFINFPAGLMLYWFVNNILSFLQQWYIMHSMEKAAPKKTK